MTKHTRKPTRKSQRVRELETIGGSRILMQGGVNPALPFAWYTDLLKHLRREHPTIDLDCFSQLKLRGLPRCVE